jgi:hypothetical protein
VKITIAKLAGAVAVCSVVLFLMPTASEAGMQGDAQWCAVTDSGGENVNWDCEYDTVEECKPAVTNAARGFCALNPYWRPDADKDKN